MFFFNSKLIVNFGQYVTKIKMQFKVKIQKNIWFIKGKRKRKWLFVHAIEFFFDIFRFFGVLDHFIKKLMFFGDNHTFFM